MDVVRVSHRAARPSVAIAAAAIATAAQRLATILAATAAVTISRRIVVTRIAAPSAAVRLATRRRTAVRHLLRARRVINTRTTNYTRQCRVLWRPRHVR